MTSVLCFGEVLWDCVPQGLFLGGAPMNVAFHLEQLGQKSLVVSAVGEDFLGREIRRRLHNLDMSDAFVHTSSQQTGVVLVDIDAAGSASYDIVQNVAWDDIIVTDDCLMQARTAPALVFGSLALRNEANRSQLEKLRSQHTGMTVFDINLRQPYDDVQLVQKIALDVDLVKLNDEELARFTSASLEQGAQELCKRFACKNVCITAGAEGAGLWWQQRWYWCESATVTVADTIGAGDSFMAALLA